MFILLFNYWMFTNFFETVEVSFSILATISLNEEPCLILNPISKQSDNVKCLCFTIPYHHLSHTKFYPKM